MTTAEPPQGEARIIPLARPARRGGAAAGRAGAGRPGTEPFGPAQRAPERPGAADEQPGAPDEQPGTDGRPGTDEHPGGGGLARAERPGGGPSEGRARPARARAPQKPGHPAGRNVAARSVP